MSNERDWLDPVVEGERAQKAAEEELFWAEEREREAEEEYERKRQAEADRIDAAHDAWLAEQENAQAEREARDGGKQ